MPVKITQTQSHKIEIRYRINSCCTFEGKNCNSEQQPSLGTGCCVLRCTTPVTGIMWARASK